MCLHDTPCYRCTVTRSVLHHQKALKITCRVGLQDNSQVKMLAAKPYSLIPGTCIVEADSDFNGLSFDLPMRAVASAISQTPSGVSQADAEMNLPY